MVHNCPVGIGFAKVSIDDVLEGFHEWGLPVSPNEDVTSMIQAKGSFVQWPKEHIILVYGDPNPIPNQMPATVSESSAAIQTSEEAPKHTELAAKMLSTPTTVTPYIFESPAAIQTSEEPK